MHTNLKQQLRVDLVHLAKAKGALPKRGGRVQLLGRAAENAPIIFGQARVVPARRRVG
jgi:hypothetical protein